MIAGSFLGRAVVCLNIFLLVFTGTATAAPDEKFLMAANREQSALIETLKSLVMIESGSSDASGLAAMADVLDARLQALGFATERQKSTTDVKADTVIGTIAGTGRRKIMLMAHMDTIYETGILQTQPWKIDGNNLYGPGIADDKGGIGSAGGEKVESLGYRVRLYFGALQTKLAEGQAPEVARL